ncbi:hypothetical protein [Georgenia muralis]
MIDIHNAADRAEALADAADALDNPDTFTRDRLTELRAALAEMADEAEWQ